MLVGYVKELTTSKTQAMKEDVDAIYKIKNKEASYAPLTKK